MFFLILISAFSSLLKEKPVAVVGNKKVLEEDVPANLTLDQHLQNIVFFELAKDKGYDDSVKAEIDRNFDQRVVRRVIERFSKSSSEPTLYECVLSYRNSKKKVEVQLIQTRSFVRVLNAYFEVLMGKDFGAISEKYSFSPEIRKSNGFLKRPLSWSSSFPRIFNLIFNMDKGDISVPLKYGTTWNIMKIIDIEEQDGENVFDRQKMLEEINRPEFKRWVSGGKSSLYMYRFRGFVSWIANARVDSKGLSLLLERINALREKSTQRGSPFKEEDLEVVVGEGAVGKYKIKDFIEDALKAGDLPMFGNEEVATQFIQDNIFNRTLVAMSRRLGVHRDPSLLEAYNRSLRDATLDFFKGKEILPIIKENENDLKAFYENNKEKYRIAERREVFLIEVKEEQEAQEIRKKLLKGKSFKALAQEVSIGRGKKKGGDIGYIQENQMGAIGREAFLLKKGEISKVFKTKRAWAIIKVTDIKKSYLPDYSDVKASVRIDYRENKAKEIGDTIFDQNKDKYGLKVLN
jgi:hypothetical protein